MNKFIKAIGLMTLASIVVTAPAYGAIEQVGTGKQVKVSGTAEPDAMVAIEVYKGALADGVDGNDLASAAPDYLNILVCHDQVTADADGKYEFNFNINKGTGWYSFYTATESSSVAKEEFMFIDNEEFKTLIEKINGAAAAYDTDADATNDVKSLISVNPYSLGLTTEEFNAVSTNGLANVIFGTKTDAALDKNDREAVWTVIDKVYFVELLNEGKIGNIYNYEAVAGLASLENVKDWYAKDYVTAELKTDFTTRLSKRGFTSIKKYEEAVLESFILATVKNPNGNGNVRDIITAFADKIGVDATKGNDDVWKALAGKDYADYGKLAYAFDNPPKIDDGDDDGDDDGGYHGGSGGGGGSVTIKPPVAEENPPAEENKPGENTKPQEVFDDIAGVEWAKEAIVTLVEKGILSGDGDGNFRPNDTITRAEFCKLIIEAFLPNSEGADIEFTDVADDAWYKDYISRAYAAGIAKGIGDGSFGVDAPISRQDMAVMTYNAMIAAGREANADTDNIFNDDESIADYARDAVYALKNMGAINGMTDGGYAPLGTATRAQAAKIVGALLSE